jgi:hypothetical protein
MTVGKLLPELNNSAVLGVPNKRHVARGTWPLSGTCEDYQMIENLHAYSTGTSTVVNNNTQTKKAWFDTLWLT